MITKKKGWPCCHHWLSYLRYGGWNNIGVCQFLVIYVLVRKLNNGYGTKGDCNF